MKYQIEKTEYRWTVDSKDEPDFQNAPEARMERYDRVNMIARAQTEDGLVCEKDPDFLEDCAEKLEVDVETLQRMPDKELFAAILDYEGICDYADWILELFDNCFGTDFTNMN